MQRRKTFVTFFNKVLQGRQIMKILIILYLLVPFTVSKILRYDLTVKYFTGAPDGVTKRILGVNGQFPGPTIRASKGDILIIRVTNKIDTREPTTIHWHGLEQVLTPFQDGLEGVTQCGIPFNVTMTYYFELNQAGTYWWHSHHSTQYTDGCWGSLIISNRPKEVYEYDEELVITVNEWYHKSSSELLEWYLSPASKGNEPIPDSVMINGRGFYPCDYASLTGLTCNRGHQKPLVLKAQRGKVYRIRLINTSSMANFNFSIDNHMLETIEVDGVDTVQVRPVDVARIFSGQRYSFLVKMNAGSVGNSFWIRASAFTSSYNATPNINAFPEALFDNSEVKAVLLYVNPKEGKGHSVHRPTNATGEPQQDGVQGRPASHNQIDWTNSTSILAAFDKFESKRRKYAVVGLRRGNNFTILTPSVEVKTSTVKNSKISTPQTSPKVNSIVLNSNECRPKDGALSAPASYDQLVELSADFFQDDKGVVRAGFNRISYDVDKIPVLWEVMVNNTLPSYVHPIRTPLGKVVQVVITNPNPGGHPFHLHGHTFWVVGNGRAPYNDTKDGPNLNLNGARRDTTSVGPNGWVAIRYITDNPGSWLLHCHYNWHLHAGLGAVFIEGEAELQKFSKQWVSPEGKRICSLAGVNII